MNHLFPYRWNLSDGYPAPGIEPNGLKVFGTFICGGGSSMGYKLAGFNHLGGVEIDEKVSAIYERNHHPKYLFTEDLRVFNQREDLPDELYQLDILDGSPPCSTFSMCGDRERAWGKEKIFAEGQALQTLDDLVFVYCETIKKLQPKVFLLENVKGLSLGNARSYLRRIFDTLSSAGYACQVFILNAASMGVPQIRERCFVIGHRKDISCPPPPSLLQRGSHRLRRNNRQNRHPKKSLTRRGTCLRVLEEGRPIPRSYQRTNQGQEHRLHHRLD